MRNIHYLVLVLLFVTSCSSVAGLRDKSYTMDNQGFQSSSIDSLTILPVKDDSAVLGLSESLEVELTKALQFQLPRAKIVSPDAFRSYMAENDLINEYAQWRSAYDETKILSLRPLKKWSQIARTRYFLVIMKVTLSREITKTPGYSGWVNDADNIWRTDLRVLAQVIDTESGTAPWKGVGHAENIHSPKRIGHTGGLIVGYAKNPEMDQYMGPMVKTAVNGLVTNIAPGGSKTISPR